MKTIDNITVTRVHSAIVPSHRAGARAIIERRSSYALSFSLGGEIVYRQGDEQIVSDEGSVIIHPMGESYELFCSRAGSFGVINFYTTHFFTDKFIKVPFDDLRPLIARFKELREAFLDGAGHHRLMRIMYDVLELVSEARSASRSPVLGAAIRVVGERYTDRGFDVREIASAVHVSESYLRRLFSEAYGISPKKYLHKARIERAKLLLGGSVTSVGDVSEECGFSGVYHFCRAFKEATGMTPTEYRRTHRSGMGV